GYRITGAIAYCYGVTAWTYDHQKPGFSKQLAIFHKSNGVHGDNLKLHQQAWKKGVDKAYLECCNMKMRGSKMDPDALKVVLRYFSNNKIDDLYYMIYKATLDKISVWSHVERNSFRRTVEKGCIYNY
ncbi:MAG: hypothetical protein V2J55_10475, partial [Candidatus Competibacteraceae bacterium]|nr:hypothetical protein [Candidatus Competibacteraceae bacterium]